MTLSNLCRYHRVFVTFYLKEQCLLGRIQSGNTIGRASGLQPLVLSRKLHSLLRGCNASFRPYARNIFTKEDDEKEEKQVMKQEAEFQKHLIRNKDTFLAIIAAFNQSKKRHGQVEFVTAALRTMEDYGVERDIECYKKLLDVFPKGKMVPSNTLQADMMHFPRHQYCAMDLLDRMERNAVCPDLEMQRLFISIFGRYTHASRKLGRMLYWMPKFKNLSPFPLPDPLPTDVLQLATLAIKRISSVDLLSEICIFNTDGLEDALDQTWIVSCQSPKQKELLKEHEKGKTLFVEGPFIVWLKKVSISYFVLRADGKVFPELEEDEDDVSNLVKNVLNPLEKKSVIKKPSVHEQDDYVIMAMCATGTSSRDSLLSWIRLLHRENPVLDTLSVLFTLRAPSKELVTVNDKRNFEENTVEQETESSR